MRTVVYHYTTYDVGLECILADRELRATCLAKTNDPYEYKQRGMGVGFGGGRAPRVTPHEAATPYQVNTAWRELTEQRTKVLSFTADSPDDSAGRDAFAPGFAKPRMWAQYGENHSGVCLGFDLETLLDCMSSGGRVVSLAEIDQSSRLCLPVIIHGPVQYGALSDLDPVIANSDLEEMELEQILLRHLFDNAGSILFSKAQDWSAENEYRIVVVSQTSGYERFDIGRSIASIFIGAKAPPDDEAVFQRLCDTACTLYRMNWDGGVPAECGLDETHFLRKDVLRRINRQYKNDPQTLSRDDFVSKTYSDFNWGLYMRCVYDTAFNDSYDEIAELKKWIGELDRTDA